MINKRLQEAFLSFLLESARDHSKAPLFNIKSTNERKTHVKAYKNIEVLLESQDEYYASVVKKLAEMHLGELEELRVQLLLEAFRELGAGSAGAASPEKEHADDDADDPAAADSDGAGDLDDDEASELPQAKAKAIIEALKKDFTYVDKIIQSIALLREGSVVGRVVDVSTEAMAMALVAVKKLKKAIKGFFDLLGLKGALVLLARLMARSRMFDTVVRSVLTVVIGTCILVLTIVIPIIRFVRSPTKLLQWIFEEVDVEIPDGVVPE